MIRKSRKEVSVPKSIITKAKDDMEGAFAFMLISSQGVPMITVISVVNKLAANKDKAVAMMCLAASSQVRGNVTFLSPSITGVDKKYKELMIDSERDVDDEYNFKALHAVGHMLLALSDKPLAKAVSSKVGNCIVGGEFPDTAAGKINKEIYLKWSPEERTSATTYIDKSSVKAFVNEVVEGAGAKAAAFSARGEAPATTTPLPKSEGSA